MSSICEHVYICGIDQDILRQVSDDKFEAFLKKHAPDLYKEIKEDVKFGESFNYVADEFSCDSSHGDYGRWTFVAGIIYDETGIGIEYRRASVDGDFTEAFGLPACYPWQYTDEEKKMTPEKLDELLRPYFQEMGVAPEEIQSDNIPVEYYG